MSTPESINVDMSTKGLKMIEVDEFTGHEKALLCRENKHIMCRQNMRSLEGYLCGCSCHDVMGSIGMKIDEEPVVSERELCLDRAKEYITRDRNANYNSPEKNFEDIAKIWEVLFGFPVAPHQVATAMIAVKLCRIKTSPHQVDHWDDICGYSACGCEVKPSI